VREAATQAVYSIDEDLAQQVIDGLFEQQSIRGATIAHPDGIPLAVSNRELSDKPYRVLTDSIFGAERTYDVPLIRSQPEEVQYGTLSVRVDTAPLRRACGWNAPRSYWCRVLCAPCSSGWCCTSSTTSW